MSRRFVIAGTDTDVGKTVFAVALAAASDGSYWKPLQSGDEGGGDREVVARLSGLPRDRILPEVYRFSQPLSPHRAAELDGVEIDFERLVESLPKTPSTTAGAADRMLLIEMAGGLMVPITRKRLQTDLLVRWEIPVILVARTGLGTINHSLMSVFALKMREIPVHGVAFVGDANEDNERTICEIGEVRRLGRLPRLEELNKESLSRAFAENFRLEDFV